MGNSWVQAEGRDIPQLGSVKKKEQTLKQDFCTNIKRQGIAKGKIQELARVAEIKNTAQSSLQRAFLFQKNIPDETVALQIMA